MFGTVVFGMCTQDEEDIVRETIRAIRTQTQTPDYIYVCDNSDDATPEIVRDELGKSDIPFEVFEQERYDGHGGARQELYERAQAVNPDILCMLDANNTVDEDWLENLLEFWEDHPEYDALTGPDCNEDVHHEVASPHNPLYYRHAAIALDMDLLDTIGGWDTDFGRGEDWDLALRMYRTGADVFTSSRWCSQYLTSDPTFVARKRIAGNPSSVPYLSKYGTWYARFHPAQIGKDCLSLAFYLTIGAGVGSLIVSPLVGGIAMLTAILILFVQIGAFNAYARRSKTEDDDLQVRRPFFMLLYGAPSVIRSLVDVLRGSYRSPPRTTTPETGHNEEGD